MRASWCSMEPESNERIYSAHGHTLSFFGILFNRKAPQWDFIANFPPSLRTLRLEDAIHACVELRRLGEPDQKVCFRSCVDRSMCVPWRCFDFDGQRQFSRLRLCAVVGHALRGAGEWDAPASDEGRSPAERLWVQYPSGQAVRPIQPLERPHFSPGGT